MRLWVMEPALTFIDLPSLVMDSTEESVNEPHFHMIYCAQFHYPISAWCSSPTQIAKKFTDFSSFFRRCVSLSLGVQTILMASIFFRDFYTKVSELEREKRMGCSNNAEKYPKMIGEHPVFVINQKTNQLLMSKRGKLKTIREKNAEELIKQGKRWERERLLLEDQDRKREIATKKEREKMLEQQTLYIFDADKVDMSGMDLLKIKSRKFTECEIDLKDFLLSEKNKKRMSSYSKPQSSEDRFGKI